MPGARSYETAARYARRRVEVEGVSISIRLPWEDEKAATPLGLLAASLASCMGVTLELAADALGRRLENLQVDVQAVFNLKDHSVEEVQVRISGKGLDEKLVRMAEERCTVGKILEKSGVRLRVTLA